MQRLGPAEFLAEFKGYLQADAYGGYDGICSNETISGVTEVACWAHCPRYWHKAKEQDPTRSHHVLAYVIRLYEVERTTRYCDALTRQSNRHEHALPLLKELGFFSNRENVESGDSLGEGPFTKVKTNSGLRLIDALYLVHSKFPLDRFRSFGQVKSYRCTIENSFRMFEAVCDVTSAEVVDDTSKNSARMRAFLEGRSRRIGAKTLTDQNRSTDDGSDQ